MLTGTVFLSKDLRTSGVIIKLWSNSDIKEMTQAGSASPTLSCTCWSQSDPPSHRRRHQEKPVGRRTSRFFFTLRQSGRFKRRMIRSIITWSQTNHAMKIMKMKRTGGKKPNLNLFLLDGCLIAYQAQITTSGGSAPSDLWTSLNYIPITFPEDLEYSSGLIILMPKNQKQGWVNSARVKGQVMAKRRN